jgi:3-hydroxybutyryl-CoA dehydrogenase
MTIRELNNISIIGIGNLGRQIAEWSTIYGYNVHIYDVNPLGLTEFVEVVSTKLKSKKSNGQIHLFNSLSKSVENADLIIEAVPEKLELKKIVLSEIDKNAPPHAILATNSSSIPVSRLEDSVERKNKLLNIHFYKLPHFPMADIARGTQTDDETFSKGKQWLESIDVTPLVLKKECLGFVFNRVWRAIKKECLKIWVGGYADIEDVDKAWKIFTNMNMGPFEFMDVVGLDVVYDIEMMYYNESGDPGDKPPQELKDKIEKNELGQKTGKGFYDWKDDKVIH